MSIDIITLASAMVVLATTFLIFRGSRSHYTLPPGPKGLPIIGNAFDMPDEMEWLTFTRWAKTFGDIMSVKLVGQPVIILNSFEMASDLMEKKEISNRPRLEMAGELVGWISALSITPYGDRFRAIRRHLATVLAPKPVKQFEGLQEHKTVGFAQKLLESPERFGEHIRNHVGSVVLNISHGYDTAPKDDFFIALADRATEEFSEAARPGAFFVDFIPSLKYVPEWVPGASFKRKARVWRRTVRDLNEIPYNMVLEQVKEGTAAPSFLATMLEGRHEKISKAEEDAIQWAATGFYSGGADTTVAAITNFVLAMTLFPDVQAKAQAEIDSVVGRDRLPRFKDRPSLLYVDALVKELLRWAPVVPSGLPHLATEDVSYKGYDIPKGSMVMANIWGMHRDERAYPNPTCFDPARFLDKEKPQRDSRLSFFGFGRRLCPGQHLADASIYLSCAQTLALFNISKARTAQGEVITPEARWLPGVVSHPVPFQCDIKPRSEAVPSLVARSLAEY